MLNCSEMMVPSGSGEIPCIRFGTGEKNMVLIPGLRTSSIKGQGLFAAWYFRMFAKDYTVYMLDRRTDLSGGCTIHDLAEETYAAARKLGLDSFDLYGVSMGGMIAADLAVSHPDAVRKLVLGVTALRTNDTILEAVGSWISDIRNNDVRHFVLDYMKRGYSERYLKQYRIFLPLAARLIKVKDPDQFLIQAEACLTCDIYDRLHEIRCPVLVLGAAKDRVVSGEASLEMIRKLGCESYIYPDLSHEAYNEAKDFNKRVFAFLKKDLPEQRKISCDV
ncbi:MAG: alpha/beta hydrolase [Solobacterium sp.]|nr:alpha/beta hydrolase [Solobacterium sp.]